MVRCVRPSDHFWHRLCYSFLIEVFRVNILTPHVFRRQMQIHEVSGLGNQMDRPRDFGKIAFGEQICGATGLRRF